MNDLHFRKPAECSSGRYQVDQLLPDSGEGAQSSAGSEIGPSEVKALQGDYTTSSVALAQTPAIIVSMKNHYPVTITDVQFVGKRRLESLDHALLARHLRHRGTCTGNGKGGGSRWSSGSQHLWVLRVWVDRRWSSCKSRNRSRRHHPLWLGWSRGSGTVLSIAIGSSAHHGIRT